MIACLEKIEADLKVRDLPLAEDSALVGRNPIRVLLVRALATARARGRDKARDKVRVAAVVAAGARGVSLSDRLT